MVALLPRQQTPLTLATAPTPQEDLERQRLMTDAWKAYRGQFLDALKVEADQPNDNVKVNRCSPIVTKSASFLFGQTIKIECKDQDFLTELWGDDDEMMTRFSKIKINGGVLGHVFVKLIPKPTPGAAPRLVILNPQIVRVVTDPDDCELVLAYIIDYPGTPDLQKRQVICRIDPNSNLEAIGDFDPDDTWTISNYYRRGPGGSWVQKGATEDWLYPFPPIFDWQNLPNPNEFWGTPNLTDDLIGLNKSINFLLTNLARIIKYHGHPKVVLSGVRSEQISITVDESLCLPSPESKATMLAPMTNFHDLLAVIGDLRSSMDEQSRVPSVALGRLESLPRGNISGVALKLLFQPLMELTTQEQRLYGSGIRNVTRAGLVLAGKIPLEQYRSYKVGVTWPNLLPIDDLVAAQTAQILLAIGISEETVFGELGYDINAEFIKRVKEAMRKQKLAQVQPDQAGDGQQQNQGNGGQPGQQQQGNQQPPPQQQGGQQAA